MCTPDGDTATAVKNMLTDDFLRDLNSALSGQNNGNTGMDYSTTLGQKNNSQTPSENSSDHTASENEKKDFASKLPCNGIFCITIGTTIGSQNLLSAGK